MSTVGSPAAEEHAAHPATEQPEVSPPRVNAEGQQMNGIIEDRSSVSSTDMLVSSLNLLLQICPSTSGQGGFTARHHLCLPLLLCRIVWLLLHSDQAIAMLFSHKERERDWKIYITACLVTFTLLGISFWKCYHFHLCLFHLLSALAIERQVHKHKREK